MATKTNNKSKFITKVLEFVCKGQIIFWLCEKCFRRESHYVWSSRECWNRILESSSLPGWTIFYCVERVFSANYLMFYSNFSVSKGKGLHFISQMYHGFQSALFTGGRNVCPEEFLAARELSKTKMWYDSQNWQTCLGER